MYNSNNRIIVAVPSQQLELIELASQAGAKAANRVAEQAKGNSTGLRREMVRAYATGYATTFTGKGLGRWETIYPIALRKAGLVVAGYMRVAAKAQAKGKPAPRLSGQRGPGRLEDLECLMSVYGQRVLECGGSGRETRRPFAERTA